MKKKYFILICLSLLFLTACSNPTHSKIDNIDINIPTATTLINENTFGWFNDGYDFKVLEFDKDNHEQMITNIKGSQKWQSLPLTSVIGMVTYGAQLKNGEAGAVIQDENNHNLIPEIKNGYYYFLDCSDNKVFQEEDIEKFSPSSYNFTIAIYDTDNAKLYYCKLNT